MQLKTSLGRINNLSHYKTQDKPGASMYDNRAIQIWIGADTVQLLVVRAARQRTCAFLFQGATVCRTACSHCAMCAAARSRDHWG